MCISLLFCFFELAQVREHGKWQGNWSICSFGDRVLVADSLDSRLSPRIWAELGLRRRCPNQACTNHAAARQTVSRQVFYLTKSTASTQTPCTETCILTVKLWIDEALLANSRSDCCNKLNNRKGSQVRNCSCRLGRSCSFSPRLFERMERRIFYAICQAWLYIVYCAKVFYAAQLFVLQSDFSSVFCGYIFMALYGGY